ncbi:family 2A encapsulin nanocompartment cargo protein cysteine desulfurase [Danxiaibacter flavus]|uniref:cysteine desulfurase n=1 Tax=Danxiaibacter flavus TaxID=3049108 RepID=A0ABV3ZMK1_9BACT|nr:family 2A encapsulin nanocompartment cargo protein cysteine desulfurase [Chitinophagaceae bacterium DXS]
MSSHYNDIPDEAALQQLANLYFKAVPADDPGQLFTEGNPIQSVESNSSNSEQYAYSSRPPQSVAGSGASPSAIQHERYFNIKEPPTSHPDPHFGSGHVPHSVAGSGISPSAGGRENLFNPGEASRKLPETSYTGKVPGSVAGSGISPSAIQHSKTFNLDDPPVSHPDPHFENGANPNPPTGVGASPTHAQQVTQQPPLYAFGQQQGTEPSYNPANNPFSGNHFSSYLPYGQQPFTAELHQMFSAVQSYVQSAQIPGSAYDFSHPASYYFLQSKTYDHPEHAKFKKQHYNSFQPGFDLNLIKQDFPILQERINGKQIIWLDNAATTQKPRQVIDRVSYFYQHENSNIHRAAHALAARATDAYEAARQKVQRFLNAKSANEIIFVRGSTEAINLVAQSWGDENLEAGDEIIISHLEHHANIVPWQILAGKKNLRLSVIPVDDHGQVILDEYAKLLSPKTKLVAFTQVSNALGTITPAKQMIEMAHAAGAKVLLDGAQAVSHMRVDVSYLDCDWYVFSGHKVFGPTGIGVLYGKEDLLNDTQPWQGGGNMIQDVTFEHTKYQKAPTRFEAGTGNIADAVGLGAAIDYVMRLGMDNIGHYEHFLLQYAISLLKDVPGLRMIGTAAEKAGVLSFVVEGFRTEDVGKYLNEHYAIAVRSGHHCAQPILRRFGVETTVRPSLALYNTCSDIDTLVLALHKLKGSRKGNIS